MIELPSASQVDKVFARPGRQMKNVLSRNKCRDDTYGKYSVLFLSRESLKMIPAKTLATERLPAPKAGSAGSPIDSVPAVGVVMVPEI